MALFCYECYDFVYDSEMERVRAHAAGGLTASRKRKSQGVEDDRAFLKSNSTKRLCGPTGIRGLYNLGQTCYQNVILQTLLHNPLLTTYFLRDGHRAHSCEQPLCLGCAVSEAFGEFYNSEKSDGYGAVGLLLATWRTNTVSSISWSMR
jgi:ubiquitin carboxyl-terminal hydrolase 22/27/51